MFKSGDLPATETGGLCPLASLSRQLSTRVTESGSAGGLTHANDAKGVRGMTCIYDRERRTTFIEGEPDFARVTELVHRLGNDSHYMIDSLRH